MLSISLGPLALPVAPMLLLATVWASSWLASRLAPPEQSRSAGDAVFMAAVLGLLAARIGHVARYADLYLETPLSVFDIRDGGWLAWAGLAAGSAWLVRRAWRAPALRRSLAGAATAGAAAWLLASWTLSTRDAPTLPTLTLTELGSGRSVDLSQAARGRPVVVNLWASWCGPCRQEMPLLAAAQQRESTVGFLFVNQGETPAAVNTYLIGQGLALREVLLDATSRLGPAVGSPGLPTTLFYDADGRRVDAHFGVLNAAALEARLRALRVAGAAVAPAR
jgi:thiol-disulfide isomerase/thioredoxin